MSEPICCLLLYSKGLEKENKDDGVETEKALDSVTEDGSNTDQQELRNNENIVSKTSRKVFSAKLKELVVKFAKENGLTAAGRKFGVSANSVKFWRKAGYKPKVRRYADDFKEMVVSFGEVKGSWKDAAEKFGVEPDYVRLWAIKMVTRT